MTFGAIKSRIADELVRPDLASQIALAVSDAIAEAATYRFWFNEVRGLTFTMTPGQDFYDSTTLADIPYIGVIDAIWIIANGQRWNLGLNNALNLEDWQQGQSTVYGQPSDYSRYGNGLRFYMSPNQSYVVGIDGTTRFAPLVSDADDNPYLTEGERYVRALAKSYVLENVVRDFDEADRQWALAERMRKVLAAESGGRMATNDVRCWL